MASRDYFDLMAPEWDKMRAYFFSPVVRDKALSAAGVKPGQTAADIGAGTGFITEGLIQKGLTVIAVDRSEEMLAEMRRKFAGVEGIDYRAGEGEHLPIPDETVDYAFANMYLHHAEFPAQAIREMRRTLKLGGKLVITDLDEHEFRFLRDEHHDRWMGFQRASIRQWFKDAGLKNVMVDCVGEQCCAQSASGGEHASISIFVACGER